MDVYKLYPGETGMRRIERHAFEVDTMRKPPWYRPSGDGASSQFAVCPACDNPIQIVGLYRLPRGVSRPYGKHATRSIPGLAPLNPETRDACPYFRPRTFKKSDRRSELDDHARRILRLLIEQFDRVVYLIGKDTGIWFSRKMLATMLQVYRSMQGYLYMGATLLNVPWIFAYMTNATSLYYQKIADNAPLSDAVRRDIPQAMIDDDGRVVKNPNHAGGSAYFSLDVSFICHKQTLRGPGQSLQESMELVVTTRRRGEIVRIHGETILFDHARFQRLIGTGVHGKRRPDLVSLARSVLGDLAESST